MPATWTRDLPRATPSSVKPSCAPCATRGCGRRSGSGAFAWWGFATCRRSRAYSPSRRAQRDRRDLGVQGRKLPGRRRPLLGVHAIRPGAAPAGMRRVLARAVPPAGFGRRRPGGVAVVTLLRADAALRPRREDAALCEGRRRLPVRGLRVARRGASAETGRPVAEFPLRHRPSVARLRAAHGARRHRPGPAAVLDQHGSARRTGPRLLPHHGRDRGDAIRALLRLRPALATLPAARRSRALAFHLRPARRGVYHGLELVDDRLAQGDGKRQDGAAREHQAGRVPPIPRPATPHEPAARARPLHGRSRRSRSGAAHAERLAGAPLARGRRQPRGLPRVRAALARRVQLRQGVLHGLPERVGQRPDAVLPGQRQAGRGTGHGSELLPRQRGRHVPLFLSRPGGRCPGRDQQRLRAPLPRGPGPGRDAFRVLLDSYHDRRTAFEFIVNAAGVKRDVLLGDDGGYSDDSWDAVWEAATTVDSLGWTVEMRIPLSLLRFSGASAQVWGVRFERWIQRKNELDMLPLVRKTESGVASRFADLQGLEDLPAPKRVEVLPYVVGRGHYDTPDSPSDPFDRGSAYRGGVGADLKYGVTSNLTLDATVNPDFGQVDLDPAFVNLTAFEVKLEEKRPFFIEGGNIFGFAGNGSGLAKLSDRPQYFYSRRIGQPPQGEVTSDGQFADIPTNSTILGAAKLSGKRASGWSIGILDALTAREWATVVDTLSGLRHNDEVEPLTNYFVGRLKRHLRHGNTSLR